MPLNSTDEEASASGIDYAESVRIGLIGLRDVLLAQARFEEAVLLTHAIWWLAPVEGNGE